MEYWKEGSVFQVKLSADAGVDSEGIAGKLDVREKLSSSIVNL